MYEWMTFMCRHLSVPYDIRDHYTLCLTQTCLYLHWSLMFFHFPPTSPSFLLYLNTRINHNSIEWICMILLSSWTNLSYYSLPWDIGKGEFTWTIKIHSPSGWSQCQWRTYRWKCRWGWKWGWEYTINPHTYIIHLNIIQGQMHLFARAGRT